MNRLGIRLVSATLFACAIGFATRAGEAAVPPGDAAPAVAPVVKFSSEEIRAIVAPIALYPDVVLSQVLPASTFPLQVVQAERHAETAADPKVPPDNANWDSSVVALLNYPSALRKLSDDLPWLEKLGSAVTYQMNDVTQAIQTLRDDANKAGNLRTNDKQTISTTVTPEAKVTRIAPTNPQVVYVPNYDDEVVYAPNNGYIAPPIYYSAGYPIYSWCDNEIDWYNHRIWCNHRWQGGNWVGAGDRFAWQPHPRSVTHWHPGHGASSGFVGGNVPAIAVNRPSIGANFIKAGNQTRTWGNNEPVAHAFAVAPKTVATHTAPARAPHKTTPLAHSYSPATHSGNYSNATHPHSSSVYSLRTYPSGGYYHNYGSSGFSHGRTGHRR